MAILLVASVNLSVSPVCALTFESFDRESPVSVWRYIFGLPRPSLYVKVIGSRARSSEKRKNIRAYLNARVGGWSALNWKAMLLAHQFAQLCE